MVGAMLAVSPASPPCHGTDGLCATFSGQVVGFGLAALFVFANHGAGVRQSLGEARADRTVGLREVPRQAHASGDVATFAAFTAARSSSHLLLNAVIISRSSPSILTTSGEAASSTLG